MTKHDAGQEPPAPQRAKDLSDAADRIIEGELPVPIHRRWKPLRMGLMNLFLFEDERFPFADGRLLLRGSNGAGKSRVLAMTLPLLLDGSFRANRVEPDRDSNRQVAWNLLMDDQNSRTAYSWLEFGRVDDADTDAHNGEGDARKHQYTTIGCGMKAVRGQRIKPWFFITDLRVDDTLDLRTPDGVPLTQRQLAEKLAGRGQVIEAPRDYRRQVDERLFRLGERYDPLIDLLLQLRQPQLARKLDLDQLESALRSALPPLPEALLDDAADAFRDLDQYRAGLAGERQTLADMTKFLRPYRDHVQRGTLRAAKRLTRANSKYETAQRQQRQAVEDLDIKRQELETEEQNRRRLRIDLADADAAINALRSRPEMRDAERLNQLRESVQRQRQELKEIERDVQQGQRDDTTTREAAERARTELTQSRSAAESSCVAAADSAAPDALVNRHRESTGPLLTDTPIDARKAEAVKAKLSGEVERWRKAAAHVAARNEDVAKAEGELRRATHDTEAAKQRMDNAAEQLADAETRESHERDRLWDVIVEWFQADSPLKSHLPPLGSFSEDWYAWSESLSDSHPLEDVVASAALQVGQQLTRDEATLAQAIDQYRESDQQLRAEQEQLEDGASIEPPVPHTRDQQDREQRSGGAPLWQVVEFVKEVPETEQADWEAGLEASGLLDAWLTPDGRLLAPDCQDTQLVIGDEPRLPPERQLRRVLRVADNCSDIGISAEVVEAVLAVIGVGEGAGRIWVDRDGRWQNGPLHGRWTKGQTKYIGEDARERWRKLRLEEIGAQRMETQNQISQAENRIEQLNRLKAEAETHRKSAPTAQTLLQRRAEVDSKQSEFDQAFQRHHDCQEIELEHRDHTTETRRQRDQDAADVGLATWVERLDKLDRRLTAYDAQLQVFWAKLELLDGASRRLGEAQQRQQDALARWQTLQQRRDTKQLELTKAEAQYRELDRVAGQTVAAIVRRMEEQETAKQRLENRINECNDCTSGLDKAVAVLESKLGQFDETSQACDEQRREAADWFGSIGSFGLIDLAVDGFEAPEQPWSMTQAIRLSRTADATLTDVRIDDESWHRSQNRVHQEHNSLQQTILSREGMDTDVDHLSDGLQLVTITMQGERMPLTAAIARLEADVTERERILDEKEQETLEKYLLGEVAEGLRRRMKQAAELIELMTREVSQRPMKTGMQMRFKWHRDPEGPPGLAEACDVLRTVSATWSPAERDQIKEFLQRRIRVERDSDLVGSWHDHLRNALDYRNWYRIEISRRSGPDADWRKLTRRTYGSGSGGEKAIALTLPQLAAAAAYYHTADELAPRFILLDEAFAGISPDVRENCMELIAAFDLDVVMTSESEWGCYAGVPQLAICQLDRFADINAVVNRVYVWNGKQKREASDRELAAERQRQPLFSD